MKKRQVSALRSQRHWNRVLTSTIIAETEQMADRRNSCLAVLFLREMS